jgi:hypothetical protein
MMRNGLQNSLLLLLLSVAPAWAQTITHGPVVGGVTDTTANVFVRTSVAASGTVNMQNICLVCENPHVVPFTTVDHGGSTQQDYTGMVAVTGLQGGTYNVKVQLDSGAFSSGQFTTAAPNMSLDTFTFVVLTDFVLGITPKADLSDPRDCGAGGSTLFQDCPEMTGATFVKADLEGATFVLIGGDFDHRNPSAKKDVGNPPHCPPTDTDDGLTLCNYRRMFQGLYDPASDGMGPFVNLILRKRWIAHVWDDHDYANNDQDGGYNRKILARQVFEEYVPHYTFCPGASGAVGCIWQQFRYGQLAEFFLIDSRSQRDPDNCDTRIPPTCTTLTKSILDGITIPGHPTGQYAWLTNGICASQAAGVRWKVVFTPVVWNTTMTKEDSWAGFQHEHDMIISAIQACDAQGVVFISGDLHAGGLDNGANAVRPEMTVPAANFTRKSPVNCQSNPTAGSWSNGFYTSSGQVCNGYGVVTVSFDTISFTVKNSAGAIPPGMIAPMIITFPGPQP